MTRALFILSLLMSIPGPVLAETVAIFTTAQSQVLFSDQRCVTATGQVIVPAWQLMEVRKSDGRLIRTGCWTADGPRHIGAVYTDGSLAIYPQHLIRPAYE